MNRKIFFILFFIFNFLLSNLLFADPGVVVEAKGKVTISDSGKKISAQTGTKFSDSATITVSKNGQASLMFSSGQIKKLAGGEKFKVQKNNANNDSSIIKGLAMAYRDATLASKGPTVHGMVKGVMVASTNENAELSADEQKNMDDDLNKVSSLGLENDGKVLMQAQVFYKFRQYQKCIDILMPVYQSQKSPSDMIKGLIAASFDKMNKPDEASKYR